MTSTKHPIEKRAFKFGSAVLLPEQVVRERVSDTLTLHGYLPIKADYGISVGAIIIRARDLGVISADRARSLQIQLSSQGWRREEPVPVADERPVLLRQAIQKGYTLAAIPRLAHDVGTGADWIGHWADVPVTLQNEAAPVVDLAVERARRAAG